MDLVGVLGLPELRREAQGLRVRRDPRLGHVPLARAYAYRMARLSIATYHS